MRQNQGDRSIGIRRYRPGSLFERLRMDDLQVADHNGGMIAARIRSIKGNLTRVLNARAGKSSSSPFYGLNDLNDASIGTADMLNHIAAEIKETIMTYEPRVENVRVHFTRESNRHPELLFNVSAETRIENERESVVIDLILLDGKKFQVAG